MRIIAALDILDGCCVRLTRGDFDSRKIYSEDPLSVAKELEAKGIKYLHMVDLDGARKKMITNYRILEKIASQTRLIIDFGGGLRTDSDVKVAFASGASQVTAGSIALQSPGIVDKWLSEYGREKVILGADSLDGKIAYNGWQDCSDQSVKTFIADFSRKGFRYVICTDIGRDGLMQGPATELYSEIMADADISLIASGGITSLSDIEKLKETGCEGAIIGKAIYEGRIKPEELSDLC